MKRVKYKKTKLITLGRFGELSKGDVIDLTEQEYKGIVNDDRFKLVEHKKIDLLSLSKVMPLGATDFDLRTIPWEKDNLFTILEAKFNGYTLSKIISAMREVGAEAKEVDVHSKRIWIVDSIIEAANNCNWHSLTKDERQKLGVLGDTSPKTVRTRKRTKTNK